MISRLLIESSALLISFGQMEVNSENVAAYCSWADESRPGIEYILPGQAALAGGDVYYLTLGVLRSAAYVAVRFPLPFLVPRETAWGLKMNLAFDAGELSAEASRILVGSRVIMTRTQERPDAAARHRVETVAFYSYDQGLLAFSITRTTSSGASGTTLLYLCGGGQRLVFDRLGPDRKKLEPPPAARPPAPP